MSGASVIIFCSVPCLSWCHTFLKSQMQIIYTSQVHLSSSMSLLNSIEEMMSIHRIHKEFPQLVFV